MVMAVVCLRNLKYTIHIPSKQLHNLFNYSRVPNRRHGSIRINKAQKEHQNYLYLKFFVEELKVICKAFEIYILSRINSGDYCRVPNRRHGLIKINMAQTEHQNYLYLKFFIAECWISIALMLRPYQTSPSTRSCGLDRRL